MITAAPLIALTGGLGLVWSMREAKKEPARQPRQDAGMQLAAGRRIPAEAWPSSTRSETDPTSETKAEQRFTPSPTQAAPISVAILDHSDSSIRKGSPQETKAVALTVELSTSEMIDIDLEPDAIELEVEGRAYRTCYIGTPVRTNVTCVATGSIDFSNGMVIASEKGASLSSNREDAPLMKVNSGKFRFSIGAGRTKLVLAFPGAPLLPQTTLKFPQAEPVQLPSSLLSPQTVDKDPGIHKGASSTARKGDCFTF